MSDFKCESTSGCVMDRYGQTGVCIARKTRSTLLCHYSDPSGQLYKPEYEKMMAGIKENPPAFRKCPNCPCVDIPCIVEKMITRPCLYVHPLNNNGLYDKILQWSTDLYNKEHHPELIQPPTFADMGSNFGSAIINAAAGFFDGETLTVSDQEYKDRLDVCSECIFQKDNPGRCSHPKCGCFLSIKAKVASEECPIGLWNNPEKRPIHRTGKGCGSCDGQKGMSSS